MAAIGTLVALVLASTALSVQPPQFPSPQDCVKQARDVAAKRQRESQPMTAETYRQIEAERPRWQAAGQCTLREVRKLRFAVGTPAFTVVDGKKVPQGEDPVEEAYGVGGVPQINIIDAQGNLRLIITTRPTRRGWQASSTDC